MNDKVSKTRSAQVFVCDTLAGELQETIEGDFLFVYDQQYIQSENAKPVSLTLPIQAAPHHSSRLFPFFDGLIPEGWLLELSATNWKLDPRDRLGLLLHLCQDCIGNVSVIAS